jgi:DNA-binding MarR family transcriptional regulator
MEEHEYSLTHRQKRFLKAVEAIAKRKGRGATYREIAAEIDVDYNAVSVMADRLVAHGFLTRKPRVPSTLTVAKERTLA